MTFTIPGEPVGKGRPRVTKAGHAFTPEKTASYENLVKLEYQRQCPGLWFDADVPVRMIIRAWYGLAKGDSRRRREAKLCSAIKPIKKPDCDNIAKIIADSLNGVAYRDDAQIVQMSVIKQYAEIPCVQVTIEEARP